MSRRATRHGAGPGWASAGAAAVPAVPAVPASLASLASPASPAAVLACLAFLLVALAAGCSSNAATTTTTLPTTTTTTIVLGTPHPAVYREGAVAVRMSFPGSPLAQADPSSLVGIFPSGTTGTAWAVGNVGALEVHSFELAILLLPSRVPGAQLDAVMARYIGKPNTTLFGHTAFRAVSTIPVSGTTHYSGIIAFRAGDVAVIAVAYGSTRAEVTAFLDSMQLLSPKP